jgi:hypothetical protein
MVAVEFATNIKVTESLTWVPGKVSKMGEEGPTFIVKNNELTERMNIMRDFYVQKFKPQIPTIGDIIYSYADSSYFYKSFIPILGLLSFLLAFMASLSFGGVAFLAGELGLHINKGILFPLPSDIRPYIIGLIVCIATFLIQFRNCPGPLGTCQTVSNPVKYEHDDRRRTDLSTRRE